MTQKRKKETVKAVEVCETELLRATIAGQLREKQTSTTHDSSGNSRRSSSAAAAAAHEITFTSIYTVKRRRRREEGRGKRLKMTLHVICCVFAVKPTAEGGRRSDG